MIREYLARRRQAKALAWIEAHRRPDPEFMVRRMAQLSPQRRERAKRNIQLAYEDGTCSAEPESMTSSPSQHGSGR